MVVAIGDGADIRSDLLLGKRSKRNVARITPLTRFWTALLYLSKGATGAPSVRSYTCPSSFAYVLTRSARHAPALRSLCLSDHSCLHLGISLVARLQPKND